MTREDDERLLATTQARRDPPRARVRRSALIVAHSPDAAALGKSFDLGGAAVVIGRAAPGGLSFADPRMSRQHARVTPVEGGHTILDLGGRNGTFVDGARISSSEETRLRPNAVLAIGDTLLVLDQEPDPEALPAAPGADAAAADAIIGISHTAQRLRRAIDSAARSSGHVLLLGPTGSGKEVAARETHRLSGRLGAFVPVNCAAIPLELAEAELFGHTKGAFTGAAMDKDGYFAQAAGGTLFLDEVGDLAAPVQAKLLRVLQDKTVQPVGSRGPGAQIDVRVIAATHQDLTGSGFRSDLLARLCDWVLRLPPLAERRADILPLWHHFLGPGRGGARRSCSAELAEALLLCSWPMNVRELAKLAGRVASTTEPGTDLDFDVLPAAMQRPVLDRLTSAREEHDEEPSGGAPPRAELLAALREASGNVRLAAERRGWHRTQLYRWLKRAGIDPDGFR